MRACSSCLIVLAGQGLALRRVSGWTGWRGMT